MQGRPGNQQKTCVLYIKAQSLHEGKGHGKNCSRLGHETDNCDKKREQKGLVQEDMLREENEPANALLSYEEPCTTQKEKQCAWQDLPGKSPGKDTERGKEACKEQNREAKDDGKLPQMLPRKSGVLFTWHMLPCSKQCQKPQRQIDRKEPGPGHVREHEATQGRADDNGYGDGGRIEAKACGKPVFLEDAFYEGTLDTQHG